MMHGLSQARCLSDPIRLFHCFLNIYCGHVIGEYLMRTSGLGASSGSTRGGVGEMCLYCGFIRVSFIYFLCYFMSLVGGDIC